MPSIPQLVNRIRQTEFPVVKHEFRMRRKLKGLLTSTPSIGVGVLIAWIFISAFADIRDPDGNRAAFTALSIILLIIVCVLIPARSAGMIAVERERHTFDLLALTLLPSSGIILQKLMAAVTEAVVVVTAAVPTMVVIGIRGGQSLLDIVATYVILMATALFVAAGGMFWSCVLRNARTATLMAYTSVVGLYLAGIWIRAWDITGPAHSDWFDGWMPIEFVVFMGMAAALIIVSVHLVRRMTGRGTLQGIRMSDIIGTAVALILMAFLVIRMGPNQSLFPWHAPLAVNPLSAIIGLLTGEPHAWEMVATTLGFSIAGTMLLTHLSVRKFEALRRA